jgi:N-acetylglucosaminyldiphosphoundecaprenol N-acetyl-beta-D-mannosaminyltransferase
MSIAERRQVLPDYVNVLGVKVSCLGKQDILQIVFQWAFEERLRVITYVNANCLNVASANSTYHAMLNQADLVYPDGISVVWASRFLGGSKLEKVTGRDWIFDFCELAAACHLRFYILAGAPGVAEQARSNLLARWPALQLVGASDGYFAVKSETQVLQELALAAPQVLLVGMGAPRQEQWLAAHRTEIPAPVCWGVGALFDYVAGVEPAVPAWMNSLALEWLWRLMVDPGGKWRRYLLGNPAFAARLVRQKLSQLGSPDPLRAPGGHPRYKQID